MIVIYTNAFASILLAQTISRDVFSKSGGTLIIGNHQITFNIGGTLIPTLNSGSIKSPKDTSNR